MAYQFKNITVLIVESSKTMFDLTKSVLQVFGANQIYSAYGFDEGFDTLCTTNPDLVIIDWLKDPKNGLELTRKIRSAPESPNPFVPVILMSGYSQTRRVIAARDAGITEFIIKPFTANALYQRIEALIESPRDFVRNDSYFGPDRRRKKDLGYHGAERRDPLPPHRTNLTAVEKAREISRKHKSSHEGNE